MRLKYLFAVALWMATLLFAGGYLGLIALTPGLLLAAAAALGLVALAGAWFTELLDRRLASLNAATRPPGPEAAAPAASATDPLSTLSHGVNEMAQQLRQRIVELELGEARYRSIVESGPMVTWVLDIDQFRFVDTNENATRLFKRPKEQLIGATPVDLAPPTQPDGRPSLDAARALIARVLDGERIIANWTIRDGEGRDIPCELHAVRMPVSGRTLICGTTVDVTERRRSEAALAYRVAFESLITRLSTSMISLMPEAIDEGINRALGEIGAFAQVDRSYVFQFDDSGVRVSNTHEWCARGIEPEILRLQDLPVANYPWVEAEIQRGHVVHVPRISELPPEAAAEREEWQAESIRSIALVPMQAGGRVRGYVGFDSVRAEKEWPEEIIGLLTIFGEIVLNALTRRDVENALRRQNEALEQANAELARSNEELQQFAYIASHDLQEPLRSISGFSALLARRFMGKLGPEADEYIGFVTDSAVRLQNLINDLLEYSKIQSRALPFEPCSAENSLKLAIGNLGSSIAEMGAEVRHDVLPEVLGDPSQLMQLFQNLIGNALKFHGEAPPRVEIEVAAEGAYWRFMVRDNGIGIPAPERQRVFQIFKRLHASDRYPGSGIGLAVCKRIVDRHRGRIWVEGNPSGGSIFCFTLPMAQGAAAEAA